MGDVIHRENVEKNQIDEPSSLFEKATHTIDASVKIYSCRVDSIHNQMYQVLGGLDQPEKRKNGINNDEIKKDSKQNHTQISTLVKPEKINSINLTKDNFKYEVDPMFFKMSSAFDANGAKGLLLNNLQVHNGCQIVFDSDFVLDCPDSEDIFSEQKINENFGDIESQINSLAGL